MRDLETKADSVLATPEGDAFRPVLDADGRRLSFDAVTEGSAGHDIFVRDVATGAVARLSDDPGYDADARWSPAGRRIAFHSDRGSGEFRTQVWVMDADGSNVRRLTEGSAVNGYPAWSPDGNCIAYTSEADGDRDLWLVRADGTGARRLTDRPGFDGDPIWHPDGSRLVFATDRFGGTELAMLHLTEEERGTCGAPVRGTEARTGTAQAGRPGFSITGDAFVAIQVADDPAAARWWADLFPPGIGSRCSSAVTPTASRSG